MAGSLIAQQNEINHPQSQLTHRITQYCISWKGNQFSVSQKKQKKTLRLYNLGPIYNMYTLLNLETHEEVQLLWIVGNYTVHTIFLTNTNKAA